MCKLEANLGFEPRHMDSPTSESEEGHQEKTWQGLGPYRFSSLSWNLLGNTDGQTEESWTGWVRSEPRVWETEVGAALGAVL